MLDVAMPLAGERLVKGGVLIFDKYNYELAPRETVTIEKYLSKKKLELLKILGCQTRTLLNKLKFILKSLENYQYAYFFKNFSVHKSSQLSY